MGFNEVMAIYKYLIFNDKGYRKCNDGISYIRLQNSIFIITVGETYNSI